MKRDPIHSDEINERDLFGNEDDPIGWAAVLIAAGRFAGFVALGPFSHSRPAIFSRKVKGRP